MYIYTYIDIVHTHIYIYIYARIYIYIYIYIYWLKLLIAKHMKHKIKCENAYLVNITYVFSCKFYR